MILINCKMYKCSALCEMKQRLYQLQNMSTYHSLSLSLSLFSFSLSVSSEEDKFIDNWIGEAGCGILILAALGQRKRIRDRADGACIKHWRHCATATVFFIYGYVKSHNKSSTAEAMNIWFFSLHSDDICDMLVQRVKLTGLEKLTIEPLYSLKRSGLDFVNSFQLHKWQILSTEPLQGMFMICHSESLWEH